MGAGQRGKAHGIKAGPILRNEKGITTAVMWTIHDHPADYPDQFVARLWLLHGNGPPAATPEVLCNSLEEIRQSMLRLGMIVCIAPSSEEEDATLVETWI